MNTIIVNGKTYTLDSTSSISIVGNKVTIHGDSENKELQIDSKKIEITINGTLNTLVCDDSVIVKSGNVGNINSKGSVNCCDVNGNVIAGGSVNCDNVEGNIQAGGSVSADKIGGDVIAGGSVRT